MRCCEVSRREEEKILPLFHHYRKYIAMVKLNVFNDDLLLVRYTYLIESGVPHRTINMWKELGTVDFVRVGAAEFIDYDNIPTATRQKLKDKTSLIYEAIVLQTEEREMQKSVEKNQ